MDSCFGSRRFFVGMLHLLVLLLAASAAARPTIHTNQNSPTQPDQTGRIIGSAADESTGDPLFGVQIFVEGTTIGTLTDSHGRFALDRVPTGIRIVVARFVGYGTESRNVVVNPGGTTEIRFEMTVEAIRLEDVVVTAISERQDKSGVAATVGTIDRNAIEQARSVHPSDIMSRIPGVWVNTTSGEGHMTAIRQPLTTDPVYLFLENGVPTRSTGFFNHNALYELNMPMAGGIEVIKGPGTALYGSDAIGAVVNVSTRPPPDGPMADLSIEGGAFGFARMMLGSGGTYGRHGLRLDFNGTKSDGWRDASRYDRQSGTLTWEVELPGLSRLRTVASFAHIDQAPAGASAVGEDDFEEHPTLNYTPVSFRRVNAFRISSAYERFTSRSFVSLTPYARFNDMDILPNWSLTYDPSVYTTRNVSAGLLARYRRDFGVIDGRIVTGIDLEYSPGERVEHSIDPVREGRIFTEYTEEETVYDYGVTFKQASPYVHLEAVPVRNLRLSGGLRFDVLGYDYDNRLSVVTEGRHRRAADAARHYVHASPKLGATYRLAGFGNVFASYAHAFRVPSEGQLFRQGSTNNTLELNPVKADNLELGVRAQVSDAARFELSAYRMIKRDDIVSFTDSDGLLISTNAGRTSHRGVEGGLTVTMGAGFSLQASHSHAVHRFEDWKTSAASGQDFSGNEIDAAPRAIMNAVFVYAPSCLDGSSVALEWTRLGNYWMDPANTVKYDGHSLVTVRATANLPAGFVAFGRLTNLTDVRFADRASYNAFRGVEYAPGLPRALYIGLEYRIGSDR